VVPGADDSKRPAVELAQVMLLDRHGHPATDIESGEPLTVDINYRVNRPVETPVFGVAIHRSDDVYVYGTNTWADGFELGPLVRDGRIRLNYPRTDLMTGIYRVTVAISDSHSSDAHPIDSHWQRHHFRVVSSRHDEGVARLDHTWEVPKGRRGERGAADSAGG
jgi:hypothetical protein